MLQRALIVEDEPSIAIDLEATLRTLGFDVCGRASNPRKAVELTTSRQPDFILMDVYLDEGRQGLDCPCHGSIFAIGGSVIHGPAVEPLSPKKFPPSWLRKA